MGAEAPKLRWLSVRAGEDRVGVTDVTGDQSAVHLSS